MSVNKGELCPTCERYNSRHVVVNGFVTNHKGEILLIKRGIEPGYGKWALPGGYLDWDETLEEGVVREVREETGVSTQVISMFQVLDGVERNNQNIAVVFLLSSLDEGQLALQPEEILDGGWYSLDALPEDVAFDHDLIIDSYKKLNK